MQAKARDIAHTNIQFKFYTIFESVFPFNEYMDWVWSDILIMPILNYNYN